MTTIPNGLGPNPAPDLQEARGALASLQSDSGRGMGGFRPANGVVAGGISGWLGATRSEGRVRLCDEDVGSKAPGATYGGCVMTRPNLDDAHP